MLELVKIGRISGVGMGDADVWGLVRSPVVASGMGREAVVNCSTGGMRFVRTLL